jgi:hypothetical protein
VGIAGCPGVPGLLTANLIGWAIRWIVLLRVLTDSYIYVFGGLEPLSWILGCNPKGGLEILSANFWSSLEDLGYAYAPL